LRGRLLLLNLLLAAGCVAAWWRLKALHEERVRRQQEFWNERVAPAAAMPLSLPAPLPQVPAATYLPVAQQLLLSKDRNPDVVIEVAAPKPVPPLPRYYGLMDFGGGPRVVLALPGKEQKSYTVGDQVGEFRLAAVESNGLVFHWEDKTIRASFDELRDKSGAAPAQAAQAAAQAAAPAPAAAAPAGQSGAAVATLGGAGEKKGPGGEAGAATRPCQPGDASPAGTVADGYRKVLVSTPFGQQCYWEKTQ
jgi:hypothetical protein